MILSIVGAKFRPPANAIIQVLPAGAELELKPEPGNPYDVNAIQVLVRSSQIPPGQSEELAIRAKGYGSSLESILSQEEWHLGYVPREDASSIIDLMNDWLTVNSTDVVPGRLRFSSKGWPQVEFDLDLRIAHSPDPWGDESA